VADLVKIAAIIWYTSDSYAACRAIMRDKARLPRTYSAWQKKSEVQARKAISEGYRLYRIALDAENFKEWCDEKAMAPDGAARIEFAAQAIRARHERKRGKSALAMQAAEPPGKGVVPAQKIKDPDAAALASLQEANETLDALRGDMTSDGRATVAVRLGTLIQSARAALSQILEEKTALVSRLHMLESEALRLAEFNERQDNYVKVKVAPNTYVYRERNSSRYGNAAFFCPNCFEKKRISVLEGHPFGICHVCRFSTEIAWRTHL
jgi:hypothetical protein